MLPLEVTLQHLFYVTVLTLVKVTVQHLCHYRDYSNLMLLFHV